MNKHLEAKKASIKDMGTSEINSFKEEVSLSFLDGATKNIFFSAIEKKSKELEDAVSPIAESSEIKLD